MREIKVLLAILAGAASPQSYAAQFPDKPLRIVTSEAGGGNDVLARLVAQPMSDILKQPVLIENVAGAGGMSLGFEQAGFDVAAAVEIDPVHCAVHAFNFPDTPVHHVRGCNDINTSFFPKS